LAFQPIQKYKVLIVEDDSVMREMLAIDFTNKGYDVETAEGAIEAIRLFQDQEFHVILSDYRMPAGDGLQLLLELNKYKEQSLFYRTSSFIFMLTGYSDTPPQELMDQGVCQVFSKPFDRKKMHTIIKEQLLSIHTQDANDKVSVTSKKPAA
jgi:DNA-binding NtrC family response regulator